MLGRYTTGPVVAMAEHSRGVPACRSRACRSRACRSVDACRSRLSLPVHVSPVHVDGCGPLWTARVAPAVPAVMPGSSQARLIPCPAHPMPGWMRDRDAAAHHFGELHAWRPGISRRTRGAPRTNVVMLIPQRIIASASACRQPMAACSSTENGMCFRRSPGTHRSPHWFDTAHRSVRASSYTRRPCPSSTSAATP